MSQLGLPVSIIEDTTTYSDATNWNTDEVVKFFEDCGFQEHAQAFKEQVGLAILISLIIF